MSVRTAEIDQEIVGVRKEIADLEAQKEKLPYWDTQSHDSIDVVINEAYDELRELKFARRRSA